MSDRPSVGRFANTGVGSHPAPIPDRHWSTTMIRDLRSHRFAMYICEVVPHLLRPQMDLISIRYI